MNLKHEERVEIRVPTEDLVRWRAAADAKRVNLSAWIRLQCNDAVDEAFAIPGQLLRRDLGEAIANGQTPAMADRARKAMANEIVKRLPKKRSSKKGAR